MSVRAEPQLDPANAGPWKLTEDTPVHRTYELDAGDGQIIIRREYKNTDALLDLAAEQRADNLGKRWGEGQVIGRTPLNLYYASGLAEASRQGDKAFIRRFWNDPDHKHLRTFEGTI